MSPQQPVTTPTTPNSPANPTPPANPAAAAVDREARRSVSPAVDVFEDASGITLLADMPGVPREQLELKVEGDTLLIEGRVKANTPDGLEAVYAEVRVPRYRRSFTLSRELDSTRVEASLKDGVLTLRIPKQAHAQPRRIAVNAG